MPIFDTHCHYNLEPLFSEETDWRQYWKNAQERGVTHSVVVGTSPETSQVALDIASEEENLFAAVGIHPTEWHWQHTQDDIYRAVASIERLAHQKKVVAIGEIGLDYYRVDKQDPTFTLLRNIQISALKQQLQIAISFNLPVILHVRDKDIPEDETSGTAYWDTLAVMKELWPKGKPFILHCISGPMTYVKEALTLGAYIGVAGNITYPSAEHLRNLLRATPVERILLETDAPYLAPIPHRGKLCEPQMIADTHDYLVESLGIDTTVLYQQSLCFFSLI